MAQVTIYTTRWCGYCRSALRLLDQKGVAYVNQDVGSDDKTRRWLVDVTGRTTVPQVFINGRSVGGYDDIAALDRRGELDRLLVEPAPADAKA
jgi:glutaredoxin 3